MELIGTVISTVLTQEKIISQISALTITMFFKLLLSSVIFITSFLFVLICCLNLVYFPYVPVLSILLALRAVVPAYKA
jgi:hypothetical protein